MTLHSLIESPSLNHLGLFAKYWQPGQVKTRLGARIGPLKASQIYYAFLSHLLARLGKCGDVRTIAFFPEGKKDELARLSHSGLWGYVSQQGDDLGERMSHFFRWALRGTDRDRSERMKVVLIGSDTPHLTQSRIEQAFHALDESEIVLGPSSDGGYYLIGMADTCMPVFEGVNWSTPQVLTQTLGRLERLDVSWELLPEMTDIDELEDLDELTTSLASNPGDQNTQLLNAINAVNYQAETNE